MGQRRSSPRASRAASGVEPPNLSALRTLLHHPELAQKVENAGSFAAEDDTYAQLLVALLEALQKNPRLRALHLIARWHGNGATLRSLLTGEETLVPASALVMSTTNRSFDPYPEGFAGKQVHRIGDCAAPRLAAYAFHDGRKAALTI